MTGQKLPQIYLPPLAGLSTAPRVFTEALKPIMTYKGVRCVIYIDDILLMAQLEGVAWNQTALTLDLLETLGFLVNCPKFQLQPTQKIKFLGFQVDSKSGCLSLPEEKIATSARRPRELPVSFCEAASTANRETLGSNSSCPTSSTILQEPAEAETPGIDKRGIRPSYTTLLQGKTTPGQSAFWNGTESSCTPPPLLTASI